MKEKSQQTRDSSILPFYSPMFEQFQTPKGQSNNQKVRQVLRKHMLQTYCSSNDGYHLDIINQTLRNTKSKSNIYAKDALFNTGQEHMKQYHKTSNLMADLAELIDYYRYYSQRPMIFHNEHFRAIHIYQEKKKMVEYNRLKIMLSLTGEDSKPTAKNTSYPDESSSFSYGLVGTTNILNELSRSVTEEESLLLIQLRNRLSKYLGPQTNRYKTIEEIDKRYCFAHSNPTKRFQQVKKKTEDQKNVGKMFEKKLKTFRKLEQEPKSASHKKLKKRNSSIQLETNESVEMERLKKNNHQFSESRKKTMLRKKHFSSENLSNLNMFQATESRQSGKVISKAKKNKLSEATAPIKKKKTTPLTNLADFKKQTEGSRKIGRQQLKQQKKIQGQQRIRANILQMKKKIQQQKEKLRSKKGGGSRQHLK